MSHLSHTCIYECRIPSNNQNGLTSSSFPLLELFAYPDHPATMATTTSESVIVLITGANQGLGYYSVEQLAQKENYTILLGCRTLSKGQEAAQRIIESPSTSKSAKIIALQVDLGSDESIVSAFDTVKSTYGRLDVLLNNAAIAGPQGAPAPTSSPKPSPSLRELYHAEYDTNVVGQVVITETFLPLLQASNYPRKRIIFTSSTLGSMALAKSNNPGVYPIYRSTKSALNMLFLHYSAFFSKAEGSTGVAVAAICPGYCGTNLNKYAGVKDPRDGAAIIVKAATEGEQEEINGTWFNEDGSIPW
jgi:NAD(P)-dependent dehydrogenase (short-subunit alcohol dehydrogenase family)